MVKVTINHGTTSWRVLEFPTANRIAVKHATDNTYLEVWTANQGTVAVFNHWSFAVVVQDEVNSILVEEPDAQ